MPESRRRHGGKTTAGLPIQPCLDHIPALTPVKRYPRYGVPDPRDIDPCSDSNVASTCLNRQPPQQLTPVQRRTQAINRPDDSFRVSKPFRFLDLPGEIRNQIYDLVIPRSKVLVRGTQPQKELARARKTFGNKPKQKPSRFRLYGEILSLDDEDADPLLVMRACRQLGREAGEIFYSKTTICFEKIKTVNKWLNVVAADNLKHVQSIGLKIDSYGQPFYTKHCKWKSTWDWKWDETCARLARELPGLREVNLNLRLATWPTQLSRNSEWYIPLMKLKGNGLHSAKVKLHHYRFHPIRLSMAANKLEDRMMTAEGRAWRELQEALEAIREMEREQARQAANNKQVKILVIKDVPKKEGQASVKSDKTVAEGKQDQAKTVTAKYRTQGLAGFHRVELSMMGAGWVA